MVMVRCVYVKASGIIDVIYFFDQSILFKCRNGPVDCIQGNCLEMFSHLIIDILSGRMIGVRYQNPKDLGPLMSYSETF